MGRTGRFRRYVALWCAVACAVGVGVGDVGVTGAAASPARAAAPAHPSGVALQLEMAAKARAPGCAVARPGHARCYLKMLKAPLGVVKRSSTCTVNESDGWSACNIQNAYKLTTLSATKGGSETVAVVDAYDDPNAEADLAFYRSTNGLPACTSASGCFQQLNQEGVTGDPPGQDMGWGGEISLDLDMVSAVCPNCHIILVEANSSGLGDLLSSVAEAVTLGANVVTDSWGSGEFDGETGYDGDLDFPGVPITFSSGDGAYQAGVQYPSASQYVTSVGGTMLTPTTTGRLWKETAWVTKPTKGQPIQGSGSGCSAWEPKPAWQTDISCSKRMTADVSAVAALALSYDTFEPSGDAGWYFNWGTSVSSPIVASIYALARNFSSVTTPASIAYAHPTKFYDIKSGSEGKCTPAYFCKAGPGYDGPTGLGSPKGDGGF